MVVGIGGFRDLGDPNDPRRRRGAAPQSANIPGLPPGDREIMRTEGGRMVYYSPEEGLSIETTRRGRRGDEGRKAEFERAIQGELAKMRMEDAVASEDTEIVRRFFSDQYGQELDPVLTSRAAVLAQAMPELNPQQALKIAAAEMQSTGRDTNQRISPEMVRKIGEMSEIKPELALLNRIEREKRGRGVTDAGVADISMSPAESAALTFALDERGRAAERAEMGRPASYQETSPAENADFSAELGARGRLGKKTNPYAQQRAQKPVEEAYEVPVLVAPVTGKREGVPQSPILWNKDARKRPYFDTRKVQVAKLNPQMIVPAEVASALGLTNMVQDPNERSNQGVNVPAQERTYFAGAGKGEPTSFVPGFTDRDDPASNYAPADVTLSQAVQQIAFEGRPKITTMRYGKDVMDDGEGRYFTSNGVQVFPMQNQPAGYAERDLIEVRVGSPNMLSNEAMNDLAKLFSGMPGMEGYQVLMTNPLEDPTINQAQNRLLQMAIDPEILAGASKSDTGDMGADPTRKPTYQMIRALKAGKGLPPTDQELGTVELISRLAGDDYNEAVTGILRSSDINPAVKALRTKYRQLEGEGVNPKNFDRYASALGRRERVPTEREREGMEVVREQYRALPDFANQAELDALTGGSPTRQDRAVDFAAKRQATIQAASNVPQAAVANSVDQSQLNAPASPQQQASNLVEQTKQRVMNMFRGRNR